VLKLEINDLAVKIDESEGDLEILTKKTYIDEDEAI